MGVIIGIDFGTTNSLCAFMDGDRPSLIPNARGARSTPSVVALSMRGEILIGESARNQGLIYPENTIAGVKRQLAAGGLLAMGNRSFSPEELASLILASLKADAERHLQKDVHEAVITAPAHFSDRERRALIEAGRLAGLDVLKILNEPTAAALARAHAEILPLAREGRSSTAPSSGVAAKEGRHSGLILVYDFGGGTFDVTVLRQAGNECTVLSSRGDGRLGGSDIDRELFRLAAEGFHSAEGLDVETDRLLVQSLMDQAERAKIELSERTEASMSLPFVVAGKGELARVIHPVYTVSLGDFEALVLPFVERSMELTRKALCDAGLTGGEVETLVLSGGTSRVPLIRRRFKEEFGLQPSGGVNPEEIVALGAAVAAGMEGGSSKLRFTDVVSRTYGVEVDGGTFIPLIHKNSPVPAKRSRIFTTVEDGQESVEIHVLQGESRRCEKDLSLGRFLLAGLAPAKAGSPQIRVDFGIDESDILHVSAVDLDSGLAQAISIADLDRGANDKAPAVLVERMHFLLDRIQDLRKGMEIESALDAELEEAVSRVQAARETMGEGGLRLLKAELEGLVGELVARRGETTSAALAGTKPRTVPAVSPAALPMKSAARERH